MSLFAEAATAEVLNQYGPWGLIALIVSLAMTVGRMLWTRFFASGVKVGEDIEGGGYITRIFHIGEMTIRRVGENSDKSLEELEKVSTNLKVAVSSHQHTHASLANMIKADLSAEGSSEKQRYLQKALQHASAGLELDHEIDEDSTEDG